ncbi:hypothetical protein LTR56_016014, partial [Elasticomyces elasticus]
LDDQMVSEDLATLLSVADGHDVKREDNDAITSRTLYKPMVQRVQGRLARLRWFTTEEHGFRLETLDLPSKPITGETRRDINFDDDIDCGPEIVHCFPIYERSSEDSYADGIYGLFFLPISSYRSRYQRTGHFCTGKLDVQEVFSESDETVIKIF